MYVGGRRKRKTSRVPRIDGHVGAIRVTVAEDDWKLAQSEFIGSGILKVLRTRSEFIGSGILHVIVGSLLTPERPPISFHRTKSQQLVSITTVRRMERTLI